MVEKCPLLAKAVKDSFLVKEQLHPIHNCNPIIWGLQLPIHVVGVLALAHLELQMGKVVLSNKGIVLGKSLLEFKRP